MFQSGKHTQLVIVYTRVPDMLVGIFCGYLILRSFLNRKNSQNIVTIRYLESPIHVSVSGFEAGLAVFMWTHHVVLASFVFRLSSPSLSALVRTVGCLSLSPSFVLAEALHVGFFFFSSLVIHILLLLTSCVSS